MVSRTIQEIFDRYLLSIIDCHWFNNHYISSLFGYFSLLNNLSREMQTILVHGQANCSHQELSDGQKMPLVQVETLCLPPGHLRNSGLAIFRGKLATSALVRDEKGKL